MRRRLAVPIAVAFCVTTSLEPLGCSPSSVGQARTDTDGDGLSDAEELNVYGTSPVLADTDGDGFSDFDEVMRFAFDPTNDPTLFNPRVADLPQLTLTLAGPAVLVIVSTDEHGTTYTTDNSRSTTATTGVTNGRATSSRNSDTFTRSDTDTSEISVTIPRGPGGAQGSSDAGANPGVDASDIQDARSGAPAGAGSGNSDGTITLANTVATTVSPSTTFETAIAFTDEQMQQNAETLAESESVAQTHNITDSAGFLKVSTILENRSHLAFRVTNVSLAASMLDTSGRISPVHDLLLDQGQYTTFQPFSLAPGEETGASSFVSSPLSLETFAAILSKSQGLILRLSTYEIDDAAGKPFAFNRTEINAKTALLVIDYGSSHAPELYQVATNLDPAHPGVTASKVFRETLRIPYAADKEKGLTKVRKVEAQGGGENRWSVVRQHQDGPDRVSLPYGKDGQPYDFDAIELRAGDVVQVSFAKPGALLDLDAGPGTNLPLAKGPAEDGGLELTRP